MSLLLLPAVVAAQPCTKMYPVASGAVAPCTGTLWPEPWTAEAIKLKTVVLPERDAELKYARDTGVANLRACDARWEIEHGLSQHYRRQLFEALAAKPPPEPWWRARWVWAAGGVLVGAGAGILVERLTR